MSRSAIVVVVDRLGAGALGPYGNTLLETPAWNRLAIEGMLLEHAIADGVDLPGAYAAYWQAARWWQPTRTDATSGSLPERAREAGPRCVIITDEPAIAEHPLAEHWEEIILLPPPPHETQESADQTAFARVFQEACGWIAQQEFPFLLWIHSRGLAGPWDAPYELRQRLADEDDPDPPQEVEPPEVRLAEDADPDVMLGHGQAYGAQIMALDACLEAFVEVLHGLPAAEGALWLFTSPRGYPLGEHGRIGACDEALYAELLHVPLVLRLPDGTGALTRSQELCQTFDVCEAVAEWLSGVQADEPQTHLLRLAAGLESPRSFAASLGPQQQAIRTRAWFMRRAGEGDEVRHELFAKPDDRWEVNEVSARCQEVVAAMNEVLDHVLAGNLPNDAALAPELDSTAR